MFASEFCVSVEIGQDRSRWVVIARAAERLQLELSRAVSTLPGICLGLSRLRQSAEKLKTRISRIDTNSRQMFPPAGGVQGVIPQWRDKKGLFTREFCILRCVQRCVRKCVQRCVVIVDGWGVEG